jgi:cytochrome c oxidase subunit 2
MKHFAIVAGLVVIVTGVVAFGLSNAELLPVLASEEGKIVDDLFDLHLYAIAFLFSLIAVFMVYSIVVFRRKPGEEGDGDYFHGHTGLEIVWTVVPLITVFYFSYLGAVTLEQTMQPEENELVIEVTGFQFGWKFNYPQYGDEGIQSTELVLPNNRQVQFKLHATDVIHSFWIPEFRVKQDAVPGHEKQIRIKPTRIGHYRLRCAELCGTSHSLMLAEVNVVEPTEFESWTEELSGDVDLTELGARNATACVACHSTDGVVGVGPTWLGLYNSERTLVDGTTVIANDEYLRNAILHPDSQVVDGFANVMPTIYADTFSEKEIDGLIEYIKTLK